MRSLRFYHWLLLLPLLLSAVLYTSGVRLPFFSDDIETQRFVQPRTLMELWTQVEVNGAYYRPLTNLLHRTVPLDAAVWHGLMLWLHMLNVTLVGGLALALGWWGWHVLAAMLLYAAFPFHAQAVLWAASIVHVLVTTLILLACVGVLRGTSKGGVPQSRGWLIVGVLAGMAAPFAHESGVVAGALVALMVWVRLGTGGVWRQWRYVLLVITPIIGAALLYWALRSTFVSGSAFTVNGDALAFNAAYLGQGISWPMQILLAWMEADAVALALLGLLTVLGLLGMFLWRQRILWALLAWIGVALAPALLLLHPDYVLYGERLLVIASPAIVLLWVAVGRMWPRMISIPVLILVIWLGVGMARDTIGQHQIQADTLRPVIDFARASDADSTMLFINLPSHTERADSLLPLWRSNAGLLTDWIELRDFLWLNANQREYATVTYAHFPDLQTSPADLTTRFYGGSVPLADLPTLILRHKQTFGTVWTGTGWRLIEMARAAEDVNTPAFAEAIRVTGEAHLTEGWVHVGLTWQVITPATQPWTPFVHLTCDGVMVAQADGDPFYNTYSLADWRGEDAWYEMRVIPLPMDASEACLRVTVGLYDRSTLERAALPSGSTEITFDVQAR